MPGSAARKPGIHFGGAGVEAFHGGDQRIYLLPVCKIMLWLIWKQLHCLKFQLPPRMNEVSHDRGLCVFHLPCSSKSSSQCCHSLVFQENVLKREYLLSVHLGASGRARGGTGMCLFTGRRLEAGRGTHSLPHREDWLPAEWPCLPLFRPRGKGPHPGTRWKERPWLRLGGTPLFHYLNLILGIFIYMV